MFARFLVCVLLSQPGLLPAAESLATERLVLHGSNTIGEKLAPMLLEAWLNQRGCDPVRSSEPGVDQRLIQTSCEGTPIEIQIRAFGTGTGFAELEGGRADLWMASRPVNAAELAQADDPVPLDAPDREHVIALDGLSVIVHPRNRLPSLTLAQVRAAFTGQIRNWREFGGPDAPIRLYARDDKSGTFDSFKAMVLAGQPLDAASKRFESSNQLSTEVAADQAALGFVGLGAVGQARPLAIADGATEALAPSPQQVAVEDYPLSRRLFLYAATAPSVLSLQFLEFAQSEAGQAVVERSGFIGLNVRPVQLQRGEAGSDYEIVVNGAERLGLNFRFSEATATLDSRAARDVDRLVRFMRKPANQGRSLRLAGFADAREMPYTALALSTDRADYIAMLLNRAGIEVERVRGLGQVLPVADNQSQSGRARNRRVEVWLGAPETGNQGAAQAGW